MVGSSPGTAVGIFGVGKKSVWAWGSCRDAAHQGEAQKAHKRKRKGKKGLFPKGREVSNSGLSGLTKGGERGSRERGG